jgi:hypothetical protein
MAFEVLSTGLCNDSIKKHVYPHCTQSDSIWLAQFDFPSKDDDQNYYNVLTVEDMRTISLNASLSRAANTMGMHSRGSGWTPLNEYYKLPDDTTITDSLARVDFQIAGVDSLILNEAALEFAFEGVRYYDLMRFALREPNPGQFLMEKIIQRRGEDNRDAVRSEIKTDLNNPQNWYLSWKGRIGY